MDDRISQNHSQGDSTSWSVKSVEVAKQHKAAADIDSMVRRPNYGEGGGS